LPNYSITHEILDIPELIANNLNDYEKLAYDLACDKERLHSIKRTLENNRLKASPFDIEKFRKNLEEAYLIMWGKLTR